MLVLCAPHAEAQSTPAFLVVPPPPEREEPSEVRAMRDAAAESATAYQHLLHVVRRLDRRAEDRWLASEGRVDPTSLVPSSRELDALALSIVELGTDDVAALRQRLADPSRVSQLDLVQRRLRLAVVRQLVAHHRPEAAFAIADEMIAVWPCAHQSARAYEATAQLCDRYQETSPELCAQRPGGWFRASYVPPEGVCEDDLRWHGRARAQAATASLNQALRIHQQATHDRQESVRSRDEELHRQAVQGYEEASAAYRAFLDVYPRSPDAYTLRYNLADALFWSGQYDEAATQYERVRDWSWRDGRSGLAADYAAEAARRVVESRLHLVDAAIARGEVTLLAPSPTPQPVPDLVAALILAREIYLARLTDGGEQLRASYLLANAAVLERYGYLDEARARSAAAQRAGD